MTAAALAMILMAAHTTGGVKVLLPTSDALRLAEDVARAEGYDLSDRDRYVFDLIPDKQGGPFLAGFVTFGFYWDGDTVNTISIDERNGLTVDPVACTVFDYPSVRAARARLRVNGAPPDQMVDLERRSGCERFRTLRETTPVRHGHAGRRR